jgi:CheY-like chemotaxis protein
VIDVADILLVEDDPHDIELTMRALKTIQIANPLKVVQDGAEALDYLFATGAWVSRRDAPLPKVVLLDLKLPRIDGLEVLGRIRADDRFRAMPIVVLTSSREERDVVESYRLGVNSYIVKPVEFEAFIEAVKQLGLYWLLLNEPLR